jgi:hypothetical protein
MNFICKFSPDVYLQPESVPCLPSGLKHLIPLIDNPSLAEYYAYHVQVRLEHSHEIRKEEAQE